MVPAAVMCYFNNNIIMTFNIKLYYIVLQSEVSYAGWVQKKRLDTKKIVLQNSPVKRYNIMCTLKSQRS